MSVGLSGCKDLIGSQPLPSGTADPTFYHTPAGALGLRAQALYNLEQPLTAYLVHSGLLTDELQSNTLGQNPTVALTLPGDATDHRRLPELRYSQGESGAGSEYANLQIVRGNIIQALGAIAAYDTGANAVGDPRVLRAELFALQGYTEILLADFFCSGVPLSTVDFNGDYTYHAGSRTDQVYQDALVQEDSALALADTSTQIQYLARVLKGRVLLARNDATGAAQVVASVPDGFQYQLAIQFTPVGTDAQSRTNDLNNQATVADTEGRNGLPYLSSNDPRIATIVTYAPGQISIFGGAGTGYGVTNAVPLTFPAKYNPAPNAFSPFVVASGVEARLIQAEAALKAGSSSWLTTLNALRTDGTSTTLPADTILDTLGVTHCGGSYGLCGTSAQRFTIAGGQPPSGFPPAGYSVASADTMYPAPAINGDPSYIQNYCNNNSWYEPCYNGDTMVVLHYVRPASTQWGRGAGGVASLAPLSDPGTDSARVALLFRERAFWLFLTGHRQGDLRRLLRQYSQWFQFQDQVFPTGFYAGTGATTYGTDVTAPIPGSEYLNPLFHGCLDRNP